MEATIEITGVAQGGLGVGRIDGRVCFVHLAIPGDVVRVQVAKEAKGVLWAEIEEVVEPSPHRCGVPCIAFGACGGCAWLHFSYPAQGEWKQKLIRDSFERIAKLEVDPAWVEDPELRFGYRTRAEFHAKEGLWGFYAPSSHDIIGIPSCPLCHPKLNEAFGKARKLDLRASVEITVNPEGDEVLVWTAKPAPRLRQLFPMAGARADGGRRAQFKFDGVPIVNGAFSQSSLLLNRLLVSTVHEAVGAADKVLDLYCGNGNLTLGLAEAGAQVVGIDHNEDAVRAADALGVGQYRAGAEGAFRRAVQESAWDVILLDPPRAGAKAIIPALVNASADAIVYVSCDPATLARDVGVLSKSGWRVTKITAVDLFPNTAHVETVCRLER